MTVLVGEDRSRVTAVYNKLAVPKRTGTSSLTEELKKAFPRMPLSRVKPIDIGEGTIGLTFGADYILKIIRKAIKNFRTTVPTAMHKRLKVQYESAGKQVVEAFLLLLDLEEYYAYICDNKGKLPKRPWISWGEHMSRFNNMAISTPFQEIEAKLKAALGKEPS